MTKNVQLHTIVFISLTSKVMLKILQVRLQQCMNQEVPVFKLDLEKAEETEIKLLTSTDSYRKQDNSRKNVYFFFIDCTKAFHCMDQNKLWKILQEMEIPDHLTCLQRNLYAGQEATIRTGHGTTNWFQIGKEVCQNYILSPCLFNLYAEYIMWNARLDEAQAGIKIAGRNINNLRYADDTILMAENKEEIKILLLKVKDKSENIGLKLNIQKMMNMASSPVASWERDW